jgi:hypothetical protein
MIRIVRPGSGSRFFYPSRTRIRGVKKASNPGCRSRIRNAGKQSDFSIGQALWVSWHQNWVKNMPDIIKESDAYSEV